MSHLFSQCFRRRQKHDRHDVIERETKQSSIEEKIEAPKRSFATKASKADPSKKSKLKTRPESLRESFRGDHRNSIEAEGQPIGGRRQSIEAHGPSLEPDPFVHSDYVFGLPTTGSLEATYNLFHQFLDSKDVAMVFFYNPEFTRSGIVRIRVQKAAMTTNRPNHAFAAVNCSELPDMCETEDVRSVPSFRLYSHGRLVGEYDDRSITAEDLQRFVETSPLAEIYPPALRPPCGILEV